MKYINEFYRAVSFTRLFVFTLLLSAVYFLLLSGVHSLNFESIQNHLFNSLSVLSQEGLYPGNSYRQQDNFTDEIIYAVSANQFNDSSIWNSVINPDYFRYWHGYSIYVTPLLVFFDINSIRIISYVVYALGTVYCCFLFWKNFGLSAAIVLLITFALPLNPVIRPLNLQFMSVPIAIFLGYALLDCCQRKNSLLTPWVFFAQGSFFVFIDFLTTPMECLGYMLIFNFLLVRDKPIYQQLMVLSLGAFYWFFGYFGTWIMKWIISMIYLGPDSLQIVLNQIFFRLSGNVEQGESLSVAMTIFRNWKFYWFHSKGLSIVMGVFYVSGLLYLLIKHKKSVSTWLSLFLISLLPFVWYTILANHSYIHSWFTYRSLGVTVCCMLLIGLSLRNKVDHGMK